MKLTTTSFAMMYNSIESEHPRRTPCIRVNGQIRGHLFWMLVYATLVMRMNLSPYPNFWKVEKIKLQSNLSKVLRKPKFVIQKGFYSVYLTH